MRNARLNRGWTIEQVAKAVGVEAREIAFVETQASSQTAFKRSFIRAVARVFHRKEAALVDVLGISVAEEGLLPHHGLAPYELEAEGGRKVVVYAYTREHAQETAALFR